MAHQQRAVCVCGLIVVLLVLLDGSSFARADSSGSDDCSPKSMAMDFGPDRDLDGIFDDSQMHREFQEAEQLDAKRIRRFGNLETAQLVVLFDCGYGEYGSEVCSAWETDLDEYGPEPLKLIHFTLVFGRTVSDWFDNDAFLVHQLMLGPTTPNMIVSLVPPEVVKAVYGTILSDNPDEYDAIAGQKRSPIISIPFNTRHAMCPIGERNLTLSARWLCEASSGVAGRDCSITQLFSNDLMDTAYNEIHVPLVFAIANLENFINPLLSITVRNLRKLAQLANSVRV